MGPPVEQANETVGIFMMHLLSRCTRSRKTKSGLAIRREFVAESSVSEALLASADRAVTAQGTVASPGPVAGLGHECKSLLIAEAVRLAMARDGTGKWMRRSR
jgi:hypothetical protein